MIRLSCTNCKTILSIDDAFAGGVCRCQHCGTIQTVPSAKGAAAGHAVSEPKAIYRATKSETSGSGLNDLAEIVASSGLSGSGLTSRRLTRQTPAAHAAPAPKNMLPLIIAASAIIALLVIIIILLAVRGGAPAATATNQNTVNPTNDQRPAAPTIEPNFCDIPLSTANSVAYVLDRGSATQEFFAALKDATIKSAQSLGSNRKFQIIFWSNGDADPFSYPQDSFAYATHDNVQSAQRTIDDINASGASDAKAAIQKALGHNPDVVIIATAKTYALDQAWVQNILDLRGNSQTKIDFINLGSADTANAPLKSLTEKTGGQYLDIDANTLRGFAGH